MKIFNNSGLAKVHHQLFFCEFVQHRATPENIELA